MATAKKNIPDVSEVMTQETLASKLAAYGWRLVGYRPETADREGRFTAEKDGSTAAQRGWAPEELLRRVEGWEADAAARGNPPMSKRPTVRAGTIGAGPNESGRSYR